MDHMQFEKHSPGSSGRYSDDVAPMALVDAKIGHAAASLSRMLNEELSRSPASWAEVSLGLKQRLEQGMQNITQGNVEEESQEQTVLLGALGGLIEMFEHKDSEENNDGVRVPDKADSCEEPSEEPPKRFQRGLWSGRTASDGVRYWRKDGHWCLVSPRCRLHGGDNGECAGDAKRIKHQGGLQEKPAALEGGGGGKRKRRRGKAASRQQDVGAVTSLSMNKEGLE